MYHIPQAMCYSFLFSCTYLVAWLPDHAGFLKLVSHVEQCCKISHCLTALDKVLLGLLINPVKLAPTSPIRKVSISRLRLFKRKASRNIKKICCKAVAIHTQRHCSLEVPNNPQPQTQILTTNSNRVGLNIRIRHN